MNKNLFLLVGSALVLAACNQPAQNSAPATPATPASAPAASAPATTAPAGGKGSISEQRTTAFKSFMPTFSKMGKMAKGDEAFQPEEFKKLAESFTKEAREPFEHFQTDPDGNGDALPNIWEKEAEFAAERDKFFAAVDKLNAAAQTGNLEEIKAAHGEVGASCKSCHDTFRRPK